jgi:hypothetical protein
MGSPLPRAGSLFPANLNLGKLRDSRKSPGMSGAAVMWVLTLLAQADRADKDPFRQPEVIWGTAGLAVALLVGALVIWTVDRWRKRSIRNPDAVEELTDFRSMYERGEITEAEYQKLRDRVSGRVKQGQEVSPALKPPPAAAGPPEPPSPS